MKHISLQAALLSALLAITTVAQAQPNLTEDFTTTTYQRQLTTHQANWNTTTGQLHLNPFTTTLAGLAATPGATIRHIAVAGRYAYIAAGTAGIQIIDLANPAAPVLVGAIDTPGDAHQIHIDGDYAYVADLSGGLRVLNISVPTQPVAVTAMPTPAPAVSVAVDGNFAFVGLGLAGMEIVDISNPLSPYKYTTVDTPGDVTHSIEVAGDYAYIADGIKGLVILDISNPVGPYPAFELTGLGEARDLVVQGNLAYVSADGHGLWIADISDPTQPALVGELALGGAIGGLQVQGERVFLANESGGLQVIDASDPTGLYVEETINTPGTASDVLIRGEYAFVACSGAGLQAVQVTQRFSPILRSSSLVGNVGKPSVQGAMAYIPRVGGVDVVDFSDPDNRVAVATLTVGPFVNSTALAGDLLLLALGGSGFAAVDISNPAAPVLLGELDMPNAATDLAVSGNHAFVANDTRLQVVDFTDPTVPAIVGTVNVAGTPSKVAVQGNLLFLYGGNNNLIVMDIANPTLPVLLSSYNAGATINGLDIEGDLAYLACSLGFVLIVDISDPFAPFQAGFESIFGALQDVVVVGNLMYVAAGTQLAVVNINNPVNPNWNLNDRYLGNSYMSLLPMGEMMLAVSLGGEFVDILQTYQHEVDMVNRYGLSETYPTGADDISKFRVTSNHAGQVDWDVVAGSGIGAIRAVPNTWYALDNPGPGIAWYAHLGYVPGIVSAVDDVTFEWLYERPFIHGITDIPDDQGGLVRLEWARSAYDFAGEIPQIVEYAVYREAAIGSGWDFLLTVPVLLQDRYSVVVPTLADSTASGGSNPTSFQVVALTATPGVFFTSFPDSGNSVDNLVPQTPQGITADYTADGVDLVWQGGNEDDFCCFRIYRDTQPGFTPSAANLVQEVGAAFWTDNTSSPWAFHYQITAVDLAGNESPAGQVLSASDAPSAASGFALHGATPNPFNPSTRIRYSLAVGGPVQLAVYDVAGRRVRVLVDDVLSVGEHQAHWDGRDHSGQAVASGVYFARLRSGDNVQSRRMMLMK